MCEVCGESAQEARGVDRVFKSSEGSVSLCTGERGRETRRALALVCS